MVLEILARIPYFASARTMDLIESEGMSDIDRIIQANLIYLWRTRPSLDHERLRHFMEAQYFRDVLLEESMRTSL